ncbi:LamG-like jellyroll fold domain-containing protein [Microbacterium thalassium]|uniref:LamG-like jellyroll fold domain-containing protein n=1 Tax=Microbacterium TaxID=33882 RepID=UPI00146E88C1|nr:LamG-like jellyroll fold domain-containing protein [Microbacterium thalassium]
MSSERSPWVTVVAQPDGQSRLTLSAVPSHTEVNGSREPVSAEVSQNPVPVALGRGGGHGGDGVGAAVAATEDLVPGVAGMLPVEAPVYPMWFNPGGPLGAELPLGVIERDGSWVKMWFPLELSEPTVDGRFVTYELAEGARLVVSAGSDGSGFRPIVELDSPAATQWFRGALAEARGAKALPGDGLEIPYRIESSADVELVETDGVGFELIRADGEVMFWSPPSTMWDSSANGTGNGEPVERLEFPLPGDHTVGMPVRIEGAAGGNGVAVVSPDEQLLGSADTVWPVRIDPTLAGRTPVEWVAIRTGGYTNHVYKWADTTTRVGESMGLCSLTWSYKCETTFTARLVWEFGGDAATLMKSIAGVHVSAASFSADPGERGNCTSTRTDAYMTTAITTTQRTWSTLPFNSGGLQSGVTAPQGDGCSDGGIRREWSVKGAVVQWADADWAQLGIGLRASNETTSSGYKTYKANAQLSITYNRPPERSTTVKLEDPAQNCASGTGRPVISDTTPTLSAVVTDPDADSVQAHFQIVTAGTTTEVWNSTTLPGKPSGSKFTATVAAGKLVHNGIYQYRVTATDGAAWSGWSLAICEFKVDTTKPETPSVTALSSGAAAIYEKGAERGGVGIAGNFRFARGNTEAVKQLRYWVTSPNPLNAVPEAVKILDAAGSPIDFSYTPRATGEVTIVVRAEDAAGNKSTDAKYTFYVADAKEDAIWSFDEGEGTTAADSSGAGIAQDIALSNADLWADGPHEMFDSRQNDHALKLDGVSDQAWTGPVVDTKKSFAVSALVWLDASKIGSGPSTAVSQDGVNQSGFSLGYLPSCPNMTGGCWSFDMRNSDTVGATTTSVRSGVTVRGDRWVHLVGASDVTTNTTQLWVCDVGTASDPGQATPTATAPLGRGGQSWAATGAFSVGRGLVDGTQKNWWPGTVDSVRVYSGQVVSEEKLRRLCQGAEPADYSSGLTALDPTTDDE